MSKEKKEKIKPSQRKTVKDAEKRRKRKRMVEGLRRLPEMPVPRSGMLAPPGSAYRSRSRSDEEFQGYLNKKIRGEIAPGAEGVYPGRIGDRFDTMMYGPTQPLPPSLRRAGMKKGGKVMKNSTHKKTAKSTRGDGCAKKGKTKGRMV